jgi:hypothetical protein
MLSARSAAWGCGLPGDGLVLPNRAERHYRDATAGEI